MWQGWFDGIKKYFRPKVETNKKGELVVKVDQPNGDTNLKKELGAQSMQR